MGKRSDYVRKPRDFYPTPLKAVVPLIPHLPADGFAYSEPCAGDGRLCKHLDELTDSKALLTQAYDIEPQEEWIEIADATELVVPSNTDIIITNPPWDRTKKSGYLLHEIIKNLSNQKPTWLLFDADWIHTEQSSEIVKERLVKIVSIGRVKWIEDSAGTGKDNCCWYLFDINKTKETEFFGR